MDTDIFIEDMDAYKVSNIIKNNQRFISPFNDLSNYSIVTHGDIKEDTIELYWNQLKYAEKNIDQLIQNGFQISFSLFVIVYPVGNNL